MEPLDREIARALGEEQPPGRGPARILVVGGDHRCRERLVPALEARKHRCTKVERQGEARAALARRRFDVVLLSLALPDGTGTELLQLIHNASPSTKTAVLVEEVSVDRVLEAVRMGAVDAIETATCDESDFVDRVNAAIIRARVEQQREDRIIRLKKICRELNTARREVSQQVDVLCNDLAAAYQDIASQMNDVSQAAEFRTLIQQELDVEDLLRTTLEYLLTKTGPTNAAVFLSDQSHNFGLGAYVNYDCPRETVSMLLDHLCQAICPQMVQEHDIVAFDDAAQFAQWIGLEAAFLDDSQVIAFSCRHESECLAVIVLFRSKSDPFDVELTTTIDMLRTTFARQLSNIMRIHHRAKFQWPQDACEDEPDLDDYGFGAAA